MNTVLLFLLISLGRTVSAQIKCAMGTFYTNGGTIKVPVIESSSGCTVSIASKLPCNMTSVTIIGTIGTKGAGCMYVSSQLNCYCYRDYCNQEPKIIHALLTMEEWTSDPAGKALLQCGLEVLQEKFGYLPTSTTTTRRIEDDETTPNDDTPYQGPNNGNGQPPAEETKCLSPTGRTESSVLYIVGGVLGAVLMLLVLVVAWFVLTYRQVTNTLKYEENQVEAVRADNDKWRRELIKFKGMEEDLEKQSDKSTMSNISEIRDVKPATVAQNTKNR